MKSSCCDKIKKERDEIKRKCKEMIGMKSDFNKMINKLKCYEKIKKERDEFKRKYERLTRVENECQTLRSQVACMGKQKLKAEEIQSECNNLRSELSKGKCISAELECECNKLNTELIRCKKKHEEILCECNRLKSECAKNTMVKEVESECTQLKTTDTDSKKIALECQINHMEVEIKSLQEENNLLRCENKRIKLEIKHTHDENLHLQDKIAAENSRVANLEKQIEILQSDCNNLSHSRKSEHKTTSEGKLKCKIERLEKERNKFQCESKALKEQLTKVKTIQEEKEGLQKTLCGLRSTLAEKESEIRKMRCQFERMDHSGEKLTARKKIPIKKPVKQPGAVPPKIGKTPSKTLLESSEKQAKTAPKIADKPPEKAEKPPVSTTRPVSAGRSKSPDIYGQDLSTTDPLTEARYISDDDTDIDIKDPFVDTDKALVSIKVPLKDARTAGTDKGPVSTTVPIKDAQIVSTAGSDKKSIKDAPSVSAGGTDKTQRVSAGPKSAVESSAPYTSAKDVDTAPSTDVDESAFDSVAAKKDAAKVSPVIQKVEPLPAKDDQIKKVTITTDVEAEKKPLETVTKPPEVEKKPIEIEKKPLETEKKPPETEKKPIETVKKPGEQIIPKETEAENMALRKLSAIAIEQLEDIKGIVEDREELRRKAKPDLNKIDLKVQYDKPIPACDEEIEALERDIENMKTSHMTPEEEAVVMRKEVEVLKKYCSKLYVIQEENQQLKNEKEALQKRMNALTVGGGVSEDSGMLKAQVTELQGKLSNLESLTNERNNLKNRVQQLENELLKYGDLPEHIDVFKDRVQNIDDVAASKDDLVQRMKDLENVNDEVEDIKRKSLQLSEMEKKLKDSQTSSSLNLVGMQSENSHLKDEVGQLTRERDSLNCRLKCMEAELEKLKNKDNENQMLKKERDKILCRMAELEKMEAEYAQMVNKLRCLDKLKQDRDMYKCKYEEMLGLECECDMLRAQVQKAKVIEQERDYLTRQVCDLQCGISDQEDEIKKLICHIDQLAQGREDQQIRVKEALFGMRVELEKKDQLITSSELKLASVQEKLRSTIQCVSCETTCLRARIDGLEKDLHKATTLISEKENQIDFLCEHLKDKDSLISNLDADRKASKELAQNEFEAITLMRQELEAARAENERLQQIAAEIGAIGDAHMDELLQQSKCAVLKLNEELALCYDRQGDDFTTQGVLPTGYSSRDKRQADYLSREQEGYYDGKTYQTQGRREELQSEFQGSEQVKYLMSKAGAEGAQYLGDSSERTRADLAGLERLGAENSALRRHSAEVQDVAKEQIQDLVKRLQLAQQRIAELEAELNRLKQIHGIPIEDSSIRGVSPLGPGGVSQDPCDKLLKENDLLKAELERLRKLVSPSDAAAAAMGKDPAQYATMSEMERSKQLQDTALGKGVDQTRALQDGTRGSLDCDALRAELEKLKQINKGLESTAAAAIDPAQHKALQDELDRLKQQLASMKGSTVDPNDYNALKAELERMKQQNRSLQDEVSIGIDPDNYNALRAELERLKKQNLELVERLGKSIDLGEYDKLKKENELLQKQNDDYANKITAVQAKTAQLEDTIKDQDLLSAGDSKELEKLLAEIARLKAELAKAKEDYNKLEANKADEIARLLKQINDLKEAVDTGRGDSSKLQKESEKGTRLENDCKELADEIERLKKELAAKDSLQDDNAKLKAQLADLQKQNSDLQKQTADLVEKLKTPGMAGAGITKEDIDKERQEKGNLMSLIDDSQKQLREAGKDVPSSPTAVTDFQKIIDDLNRQLNDSLEKSKVCDGEIARLKAEIDRLKKMIEELHNENNQLSIAAGKPPKEYFKEMETAGLQAGAPAGQLAGIPAGQQAGIPGIQAGFLPGQQAGIPAGQAGLLPGPAGFIPGQAGIAAGQYGGIPAGQLGGITAGLGPDGFDLSKLQDEINRLNKLNSELSAQVENCKREKDELQNNIDALQKQVKALETGDTAALTASFEDQIEYLKGLLEKQKAECQDTIAALKDQYDRDLNTAHYKNAANIEKLQDTVEETVKEMSNEMEAEINGLREQLRDSETALLNVKKELAKTGKPLSAIKEGGEEGAIGTGGIKDGLKQGELKDGETQSDDYKERIGDTAEKQELDKKEKEKSLTKDTFQTTCVCSKFPDVIPIFPPLSEHDIRKPCKATYQNQLNAILNKILQYGIESLSFEELHVLHSRTCNATANMLQERGRHTCGQTQPNDKISLMRRITALESELMKKQQNAQQKVASLQVNVKMEKQRLDELKKTLEIEKQKNCDLMSQIGQNSKYVAHLQVDRDLLQRQNAHREEKLQQFLCAVESERDVVKRLKEDLEKEKTYNMQLITQLERAKKNKVKDAEALKSMKMILEKSLNSEMKLRMQLEQKDKGKCQKISSLDSKTCSCAPSKDVGNSLGYLPVRQESRVSQNKNMTESFNEDVRKKRPSSQRCACRPNNASTVKRPSSSVKPNNLDIDE